MPKYPVTKNMGAALKNLRQQRKVKAVDLAKSINKTGAYISKLEKGDLNSIDCDVFINIIRRMSNNKDEFNEAINILLKDTSAQYSEEEIQNEEWRLNLDYFYRALPIKEEYRNLIRSMMEKLSISSTELSNYINQNYDLYNDESLSGIDLDKEPRNKWKFNGGHPYVLMQISPEQINKILDDPDKKTSCYANMFCILLSLYRLEKLDKDKAYIQAHNDLEKMQILTLQDTENIMQAYGEEKKLHDLLSQRNNDNLPYENKKLLEELHSFVRHIYSFSVININYANEKMESINRVLEEDPPIALKLLGTDITPLKDKPTSLKKDFFNALDELIKEYSAKEADDKPMELL